MAVFLEPGDPERYLALVSRAARRYSVDLWAYCLMPNHVHWIARPQTPDGLARAFGEAHRSYAVALHRGHDWTGHLWQQRFFSCPLDELQLLRVVRYVLANPVRAGLADHVLDWRHSSARAHFQGVSDPAVNPAPLAARIDDWESLLGATPTEEELRQIRNAVRVGSFARADRPRGRPPAAIGHPDGLDVAP